MFQYFAACTVVCVVLTVQARCVYAVSGACKNGLPVRATLSVPVDASTVSSAVVEGKVRTERPHDALKKELARLLNVSTQERPEPYAIMALMDKYALPESEVLSCIEELSPRELFCGETLYEVRAIAPYLIKICHEIAEQYAGHTVLFAGRDAELLYDSYQVFRMTHPHVAPGILFPGSTAFWETFENGQRATRTLGSEGVQRNTFSYLKQCGITSEAVVNGQNFCYWIRGLGEALGFHCMRH